MCFSCVVVFAFAVRHAPLVFHISHKSPGRKSSRGSRRSSGVGRGMPLASSTVMKSCLQSAATAAEIAPLALPVRCTSWRWLIQSRSLKALSDTRQPTVCRSATRTPQLCVLEGWQQLVHQPVRRRDHPATKRGPERDPEWGAKRAREARRVRFLHLPLDSRGWHRFGWLWLLLLVLLFVLPASGTPAAVRPPRGSPALRLPRLPERGVAAARTGGYFILRLDGGHDEAGRALGVPMGQPFHLAQAFLGRVARQQLLHLFPAHTEGQQAAPRLPLSGYSGSPR